MIRRHAFEALRGVGVGALQWENARPAAFHLRRRLTPAEQLSVGDVVDLRGTAEALERFKRIEHAIPPHVIPLALRELQQ